MNSRSSSAARAFCAMAFFCLLVSPRWALSADERVTLSVRNTEISEVMEMLSRSKRVNILLSPAVVGTVSFSLYAVPLDEAIRSIASAAGFAVENRGGTYFVVTRDNAGQFADSDMTKVITYSVQYADPALLQGMLTPYLSTYGKITALPSQKMLVIEDRPQFVSRIETLLVDIDRVPRQVLIEAQILEVTLNKEDSWGIDWSDLFARNSGTASIGTQGLAGAGSSGSAGFLFKIENDDVTAMLTALEKDGRVRTLSTPKLLALENQEASVIVGDRRGFQVTTTINQVTTESIEFLESGVILRVTPHIDAEGRILLEIHPEVSNGTVDANGIPSQTTTEVTTQLLVNSGETVFVGGLIKQSVSNSRSGVSGISRLPAIGRLFSSRETTSVNTETIVLIRPVIIDGSEAGWSDETLEKVEEISVELDAQTDAIDREVEETFRQISKLQAK